jgi:cell division transport system permease protein
LFAFVAAEAARDMRRAGRVGLAAVLLITISLAALGSFWLLSINLGRAVAQWPDGVRVVAYLREEPTAKAVDDLLGRVRQAGGVAKVRYVSRADALATLKASLGSQADVVDDLPKNPLPASVEVTPDAAAATPEGTRALAQKLAALPEVDEVQGGFEWVESLARWRRLLGLIGLGVGGALAAAAILTVTTATTLVFHLRREENEIMRLVGATEAVVRLPLVLQGMAQGLAGAILALASLEVVFFLLAPRLEPLLSLTLGLSRAVFLSAPEMLTLMLGGAALGALGGLLTRGRTAT